MEHRLWIDGGWNDSSGGSWIDVENPATGEKIASVVDASQEDVDRAVQAARTAFYDGRWSRLTPSARSLVLLRLADLVEGQAAELAKVESQNTGKPYAVNSFGADLPFLIDNNFSAPGFTLSIHAIAEVIASMKNHLFNNHTWPDFTSLPNDLTPVLKLVEVPEESAQVGESDLAIDRERVRARWQLVAEADYFALLGVRRDATSFEIRRAYESARRDFAAEGFPGELRHELARELDDIATVLDEAFRVLRDDPLRREYLAHLID